MGKSYTCEELELLYQSVKEMYINSRENCMRETEHYESLKLSCKELEEYVTYMQNETQKDSFVFSPRGVVGKNSYSASDVSKYVIDENLLNEKTEELEKFKKKLLHAKQLSERLTSDVHILDKQMNLLSSLINDMKQMNKDQSISRHELDMTERNIACESIKKISDDTLSYLFHDVNLICDYINSDPVRAKMEIGNLQKSIEKIRGSLADTIFILKPMNTQLNWKERIVGLISDIKSAYPDIDLKYRISDDIVFNSFDKEVLLYLIIKEYIRNAAKHSGCKSIEFSMSKSEEFYHVMVKDDGKGFLPEEVLKDSSLKGHSTALKRLEIISGQYKIVSDRNFGTQIKFEIPIID